MVIFFIFHFAWTAQNSKKLAFTQYTVLSREKLNFGLRVCRIFSCVIINNNYSREAIFSLITDAQNVLRCMINRKGDSKDKVRCYIQIIIWSSFCCYYSCLGTDQRFCQWWCWTVSYSMVAYFPQGTIECNARPQQGILGWWHQTLGQALQQESKNLCQGQGKRLFFLAWSRSILSWYTLTSFWL